MQSGLCLMLTNEVVGIVVFRQAIASGFKTLTGGCCLVAPCHGAAPPKSMRSTLLVLVVSAGGARWVERCAVMTGIVAHSHC